MKQFIIFLICLCSFFGLSAQNFDSLRNIIRSQNTADSVRVFSMLELAIQLRNIRPDSCILLAKQSYDLSQKIGFLKGQGRAQRVEGVYYQNKKADYPTALQKYLLALEIAQKVRDQKGEADANASLGSIYRLQGNYEKALYYYFHALEIANKIGATKTSIYANININIGIIYQNQGMYDKAIVYNKMALKTYKEIKQKEGFVAIYNTLGEIYEEEGKIKEAFQMQWASLAITKSLKSISYLAYSQAVLSHLHLKSHNLDSAKFYAFEGLKNALLNESADIIAHLKTVNSAYYNAVSDYKKADIFASEAQVLAKKVGAVLFLFRASEQKYFAAKKLGKTAEAFENYELFIQLKDSLQSEKNRKKSLAMEFKYKEENAKIEQEKKNLEQKAEQEYQKRIAYSLAGISFTLILVSLLIYKNNRQKQKANQELQQQQNFIEQQNEELKQSHDEISFTLETLEKQKQEIQEKNQNIIDYLNVGNRIQSAMFPSQEQIANSLGKGNFFVFFKPRDIVSGDFYFFEDVGEKVICIVADCTGHGIPGAFVSMIGYQILGEIILKEDIHQPDQILNHLHLEIGKSLRQDENNSKEGMDMAVVTLTKNKENPKKFDKLAFSGAMNPFYYVQNNEFFEIKGTKQPIGGKNTNYSRPFDLYEMEILEQGLVFYLCSDGFQDQFGGANNKKFMTKKLRETLFEISPKSPEQQMQLLNSIFINWQGAEKQIDDVTILGIKI